ncbi:MAG: DciA family protein [Pseudomonadota bacterium]
MKAPRHTSTTKGFSRAASLMQTRIRKASEERGFAVTRLLTHWAEVVGAQTAQIATPVNVSYGKGGMGATLTLLTTGAQATMLEMQKEQICEKVNACYGYRAISRVRITQTAPTGFAEGRAQFTPAPRAPKTADPAVRSAANTLSEGVKDDGLRAALAALGTNVLTKQKL